MLDRTQHEINLKRVLRDIYQDRVLAGQLVFKGGTCLYLFHELDRFSVDLDFSTVKDQIASSRVAEILLRYMSLESEDEKHLTWFFLASFDKGKQKIKVEISKRSYADAYEIHDFMGINVRCLDRGSLFAHKLCAITDRALLHSRDLYDTWFMFRNNFPINEAIIHLRTGQTVAKYLSEAKQYIQENVDKNPLLAGLGELLTPKQKIWVKSHLVSDLLFELDLRIT